MFIVFEGLDGSGLSTQASMLADYLIDKGRDVLLTKEQTIDLIGGLIKAALKDVWKTSPLGLQLLFAADRAHHLASEVEPSLEEGKIVICDRYILSSLAFGSLDSDVSFLRKMNSKFRVPDLTFIVNTKPEICLARIKKKRFSHLELYEELSKMEKVRKNYISFRKYFPNSYVIDGNRPIKQVFEEIKHIIDKKLKL